jgi:hypothetical protein
MKMMRAVNRLRRVGPIFVGLICAVSVAHAATNIWTPAGVLITAREGHTATLLLSGKVLVAGGGNGSTYLASAELYDPASST